MTWRDASKVFGYTKRAVALVWKTSPRLTAWMALFTLIAGLLPAAVALVGQYIIDAVIAASNAGKESQDVLFWVGIEAALVVVLAGVQKALDVCQSLLRAQLSHHVNYIILEKALTLDLTQFEDSSLYDKMTRARRQASTRPLSLVKRSFGLAQNAISLTSYGVILWQFSPVVFVVLGLSAVPAFVAETRFAGQAFRLFQWRSKDAREQFYLETVLAREDYAKEVQLLDLGPSLLGRYRANYERLYGDDRDLTLRRGAWGYAMGVLASLALYGAYGWIAVGAAAGAITVGQMTMYLLVFKQSQSALSTMLQAVGGMYEDNLYLSNLYEFLNQSSGVDDGAYSDGPNPLDGFRVEGVTFVYPGETTPALRDVTLHLRPGQKLALVGHNGSGKTTLIKLLTRLYRPTEGRITLDGRDLAEWKLSALRRRIGVIFQDFVRYQFTVGENIGVGDVTHIDDGIRQKDAAVRGMAWSFIDSMPDGLSTRLGRWFDKGRELSIGQWQKVALSRAFMSRESDVLILDEPTSAMDAEAEAEIFDRVRAMAAHQMAILISHRFSTVRMADEIVVLDAGRVVEQGDHSTLIAQGRTYARLFELQAAGYR